MKKKIIIFAVCFVTLFTIGCDYDGNEEGGPGPTKGDDGYVYGESNGISFKRRTSDGYSSNEGQTNYGITEEVVEGQRVALVSVERNKYTHINVEVDEATAMIYNHFFAIIPEYVTSDNNQKTPNLDVGPRYPTATKISLFGGMGIDLGQFTIHGYINSENTRAQLNRGLVRIYSPVSTKICLYVDHRDDTKYFSSLKKNITDIFSQAVINITDDDYITGGLNMNTPPVWELNQNTITPYEDSLMHGIFGTMLGTNVYIVLVRQATTSRIIQRQNYAIIPLRKDVVGPAVYLTDSEVGRIAAHELGRIWGLTASNNLPGDNLMNPSRNGTNLNYSQWEVLRQ